MSKMKREPYCEVMWLVLGTADAGREFVMHFCNTEAEAQNYVNNSHVRPMRVVKAELREVVG